MSLLFRHFGVFGCPCSVPLCFRETLMPWEFMGSNGFLWVQLGKCRADLVPAPCALQDIVATQGQSDQTLAKSMLRYYHI